jgi:hypothetical protein
MKELRKQKKKKKRTKKIEGPRGNPSAQIRGKSPRPIYSSPNRYHSFLFLSLARGPRLPGRVTLLPPPAISSPLEPVTAGVISPTHSAPLLQSRPRLQIALDLLCLRPLPFPFKSPQGWQNSSPKLRIPAGNLRSNSTFPVSPRPPILPSPIPHDVALLLMPFVLSHLQQFERNLDDQSAPPPASSPAASPAHV